MPVIHDLSPDDLLTTTRAVRKRLDFDRPIPDEIIRECLAVAQQAPTASNRQNWHFMVITDPDKRRVIADLYRRGWEQYTQSPTAATNLTYDDPVRAAVQDRVGDSAQYLADNLHRAPVMVIPCIAGRTDSAPTLVQSAQWGTIMPAAWSLMLAARARRRRVGVHLHSPDVRGGGRRRAGHSVPPGHAGRPHPPGLHHRRPVPARPPRVAGRHRPLEPMVGALKICW